MRGRPRASLLVPSSRCVRTCACARPAAFVVVFCARARSFFLRGLVPGARALSCVFFFLSLFSSASAYCFGDPPPADGCDGRLKTDVRWVSIMELYASTFTGRLVEKRQRFFTFLESSAGYWLPLPWPPGHGIMLGGREYFGDGLALRRYREYLGIRELAAVFLVGVVCRYGRDPRVGRDPEVLVSNAGGVFCYVPSDDRVYLLADSVEGLVTYGLRTVYPYAELSFPDRALELAWHPHDLGGAAEALLACGHDVARVLDCCSDRRGASLTVGGMAEHTATLCARDALDGEYGEDAAAFEHLFGMNVIGRLDAFGYPIVVDWTGCVYLLLGGRSVVKVAESLRGFFRWGSTWLYFRKRLCFCKLLSSEWTVTCEMTV